MIIHPSLSILVAAEQELPQLQQFLLFLRSMSHVRLTVMPQVPSQLTGFQVIITAAQCATTEAVQHLHQFVSAGGGWLRIVSPADNRLPELFGVQPRPSGPVAELRVLFQDKYHPLAARLPDAWYITGPHIPLKIGRAHV